MKNFVVTLLCLVTPLCHAARPFVTDDARTVDPGGCQVETFYKEQRAYSGYEFWFLPACNRFDVEWTLGGNRIEGENNVVVQAKKLLKPLVSNGYGLAFSVGAVGDEAYLNGIASFSFFEDVSVVHANLGYLYDRPVFGIGLEQLLYAPRVYGILETYGGRSEKPTVHGGLRLWVIPNRFQVDSTYGVQQSDPVRRFFTVGLRFLF
jgi:hypothetical protein